MTGFCVRLHFETMIHEVGQAGLEFMKSLPRPGELLQLQVHSTGSACDFLFSSSLLSLKASFVFLSPVLLSSPASTHFYSHSDTHI